MWENLSYGRGNMPDTAFFNIPSPERLHYVIHSRRNIFTGMEDKHLPASLAADNPD